MKDPKGPVKPYRSPEEISKRHNVPLEKILQQVKTGTKVEGEHTTSKAGARITALQHVDELPNYYTKLKKIEKIKVESKSSNLHKWFADSKSKDGKPGWVNVVTGGTCASDEPGEGVPKCVSSEKRASMTKAERLSASRRKKEADPEQQEKSGAAKPTYVSTDKPKKKGKKKMVTQEQKQYKVGDTIPASATKPKPKPTGAAKFKFSIDKTGLEGPKSPLPEEKDACYKKVKSRYSVWPSAYASGALVKCRKVGAKNWGNKKEEVSPIVAKVLDEKCWDGYKQEGMKKKGKKMVPNCVPVSENVKRVQTNGRVYNVMVNFYGKYYTIKLFFSGYEQPSREEINSAIEKIYPTGKVLAYYPTMNTVGSDNYVMAREEAECKPEPKGGNTTYDSAEKRRRNYLMNIGVIGEGAAWTRKEGQNSKGGLNEKGRKSYERENPGSDLKAPSKKVGNKRRASFCARMKGMKNKLTSKKTASDPNSRINKSLRAWNC